MTVGQMLRSMTLREFAMWRVEYAARPWGERRADMRSAQICALLAEIHRDRDKHPEPYTLADFMLFKDEPDEDEDRDIVSPQTVNWFRAMATAKETQSGN